MVRRSRLSSRLRRAPTRYEPIGRIAMGGMAEVWRAYAVFEPEERVEVAIKRVLPKLATDPMYRSMFEDEARLGMRMRHPNVVRVYDARDVGGTYIMIMELVDGTSLKALLDKAHARKACMPVATALFMTGELARGLAYAHSATDTDGNPLGIVHRDVSPHNLLLGKRGAVKLADFGLADANVHQTMKSEMVGGKLGYLAPEVIVSQPADRRIDVFGAGIILWEALSGRRLFQGKDDAETVQNVVRLPIEPASTFNNSVPPEVDALLAQCLERNPNRRLQDADSLANEIDRILQRIDPDVSSKDVSLLVGLHLAGNREEHKPLTSFELLANELDAFVNNGEQRNAGAEPLDPSAFASAPRPGYSVVRPLPTGDDDEWFSD